MTGGFAAAAAIISRWNLAAPTSANEKIRPKLESQLKHGVRIVSHDYEIVGWKPVKVVNYCENESLGYPCHTLYLYRVP